MVVGIRYGRVDGYPFGAMIFRASIEEMVRIPLGSPSEWSSPH